MPIDTVSTALSLDRASRFSRSSKAKKLCMHPVRLARVHILKFLSARLKTSFRVKARTVWGDAMSVVIPEQVSTSLCLYGFHEEDLTRMALAYLAPGMTVIDIGAHFGYFTLLASAIVGDRGRVHSFEPTMSTFQILKANTADKRNVVLNEKAVFSKRCTITMNDYGISYSAFNSMFEARLSGNLLEKVKPARYEIEAVSIDEYVASLGIRPDCIKIDAESAESDVLAGAARTIADLHPMIVMELGDLGVTGATKSADLIDALTAQGYRPYVLKENAITLHEAHAGPYDAINMLFIYPGVKDAPPRGGAEACRDGSY